MHKANGGQSSARNAGMSRASGEYVSFVDSDDWLEPDFFEQGALQIEQYHKDGDSPEILILGGYYREEENRSRIVRSTERKRVYKDARRKDQIVARALAPISTRGQGIHGFVGVAWNKLYRLGFLRENGLAFDEGVAAWEDSWLNLQAFSKAGHIVEFPYIGYHYRVLPESISHGYDPERPKKDRIYMERLCGYRGENDTGPLTDGAINQAILAAASEDLRLCHLNPGSHLGVKEKNERIRELRRVPCVREAARAKSRGMDAKHRAVGLLMRMPLLWPVRLAYRLYTAAR